MSSSHKNTSKQNISTSITLQPEEISLLLSPPKSQDNILQITQASLKKLTKNINSSINKYLQELNPFLKTNVTNSYSLSMPDYADSLLFSIKSNNNFWGFMQFSNNATNILIAAVLGASKSSNPHKKQSYTNIEKKLISKITNDINSIISKEKNQQTSIDIIEKNTNIASQEQNILTSINLELNGQTGNINISLPIATTNQAGSKNKILQHALKAKIELDCVVANKKIPLRQIFELKKGNFIALDIAKNTEIDIINKNMTTHKAIMGKKNNKIVLRVTKKVTK